jgi:hypothetical protein
MRAHVAVPLIRDGVGHEIAAPGPPGDDGQFHDHEADMQVRRAIAGAFDLHAHGAMHAGDESDRILPRIGMPHDLDAGRRGAAWMQHAAALAATPGTASMATPIARNAAAIRPPCPIPAE